MSEENEETPILGEPVVEVRQIALEELSDLLPDFCPDCFMPRDQLVFEVDRAIPSSLTHDSRSGYFDFLEVEDEDPIYLYIYGWWCPQCDDKGEHDFDVLYRVVWD